MLRNPCHPADEVIPFDQAVSYFTDRIAENPSDGMSYCNRGGVWDEKREHDKAIADFDEAIRLDPVFAGGYYGRGIAWIYKQRYDKAITDFDEAIRLDPRFTVAYGNRGIAWRLKGDNDKAIADLGEVIRLDPKSPIAYYNRGRVWDEKREYRRAIADFDQAIRLAPDYVAAYAYRALALRNAGELDKVKADLNQVIRLDPRGPWSYYMRAVVDWQRGRDEAIGEAREAIQKDAWKSSSSVYASIIGHLAARRAGKAEEAQRFLDEMGSRDMTDWPAPMVRYFLGTLKADELLAATTDDTMRLSAHCFLGLDLALRGKAVEAVEHLRWVEKHGRPSSVEYGMARTELERLLRSPDATGSRTLRAGTGP